VPPVEIETARPQPRPGERRDDRFAEGEPRRLTLPAAAGAAASAQLARPVAPARRSTGGGSSLAVLVLLGGLLIAASLAAFVWRTELLALFPGLGPYYHALGVSLPAGQPPSLP
jgi:hypothetical protein